MRLGISNIAWGKRLDESLLQFLRHEGIAGLELAPGLIPPVASRAFPAQFRGVLASCGLEMIGFHSLLYERRDLQVAQLADHGVLLDYLQAQAQYCRVLGGRFIVFGSPQNRQLSGLPPAAAWAVMLEFFKRLADVALAAGVECLIEPLPQAELVRNHVDGIRLIQSVASPALRLHLDVRAMVEAGGTAAEVTSQMSVLRHVHTGGPGLRFLDDGDGLPHREYAAALRAAGYHGFVSLEMARREDGPDFRRLSMVMACARRIYGDPEQVRA